MVAGLDENNQPYVSCADLIGAECFTDDFAVSGTSSENLYGMCESLYRPQLVTTTTHCAQRVPIHCLFLLQEPDELFETLAQALMAAVDRDALSGWGGVVHIL